MIVFGAFVFAEGVFIIYSFGTHSYYWALALGTVDILFGLVSFVIGIYGILPQRGGR